MLPVLFSVGPLTIYSFGFFLALSYVVATFILWREGRRQGYNEEKLLDLSVISLIAALVGGRAYYVLLNWEFFREDAVSSLFFWQGSFAYHGALVAVVLVGGFFARNWKWPFFQIADIGALSATAALVLGRIGSFLAGLDFGKETGLPWGVTFSNLVGSRHPSQIYEAGVYLAIFVLLYYLYFRNLASANMKSGKVFIIFLILTSLGRGVLEFFRAEILYLGFLPLASFVSILVATASFFALYYFQIRNFRSDFKAFLRTFLVLNEKVMRRLKI
jgi:prolipoprotein diacylglyceryl transferase